ncbi:MAG: purine-nucleoside phosphorylase [Chthoniobacteraceae bacterium]
MKFANDFESHPAALALKKWKPQWGLVLGSGLGAFVSQLEVLERISYSEIAGLPVSKVPGHAGEFLIAKMAGRPAMVASGRAHLYEGHPASVITAGIRFMAACGVQTVVLTNAAGTLNKSFIPGTWMMLNDHLNLTGTSPLLGGAHFFDMSCVYDHALRIQFSMTSADEGITLHEGVYAGLVGPQYETPAEIRMLKAIGADAVGMSTVLEAIQARALGVRVAAFSCLTNWAAGMGQETLDHSEVLATGREAAAQLWRLLEKVIAIA